MGEKDFIKITGKHPDVCALVCDEGMYSTMNTHETNAADMQKQINKDVDRIYVFGDKLTHNEFFKKIFERGVDLDYTQGDYFAGLADILIQKTLIPSMSKSPDIYESKQTLGFGYINDKGIPCGLSVNTYIDENNQFHFFIVHIAHLEKNKADRDVTIFTSKKDYEAYNSMAVNTIPTEEGFDIRPHATHKDVNFHEMARDVFQTINSSQVSKKLDALFSSQSNKITLNMGSHVSNHPVPSLLKAIPQERQSFHQAKIRLSNDRDYHQSHALFRAFMDKKRDAEEPVSDEEIKIMINPVWSTFAEKMSQAIESDSQNSYRLGLFKEKKLTPNLAKLKWSELAKNINQQRVIDPQKEVALLINQMNQSGNLQLIDLADSIKQHLTILKDYTNVVQHQVEAHNRGFVISKPD